MEHDLIGTLRKLAATGPDGFEGMVASALTSLTRQSFCLAKPGSQAGRDMSVSRPSSNVIAVECKRYGADTELNERSLLGELMQVTKDIPDLDLWVLVASRCISSQLQEALQTGANRLGIQFRSISASDAVGEPSSLEILCAQARETVLAHLESEISNEDHQRINLELLRIEASPQFNVRIEKLRNQFLSPLLGYDNWRAEQNEWLLECLQSESETRARFGQPLNVADPTARFVARKTVSEQLRGWMQSWKENKKPLVVLGEEGDGKTWAVGSWLSREIAGTDEFPPVVFLCSTNVESNDPLSLLSETVSRRLGNMERDPLEKCLSRWVEKAPNDKPILLLVLDGINERRGFKSWRALLEKLGGSPWHDHVAVLITCRTIYWQQFEKLRHLKVLSHTVPPYDDDELDRALALVGLRRSEISESLLSLIRKPRYFDLMVKYRERVAETGDVTPARLVYEDWRDRWERKTDLDLDDRGFQDLIRDLAHKHLSGNQYFRTQEIDSLLPTDSDRQAILEELRTGGVLEGEGNHFRVNERLLSHGFGLLLVDELEREAASGEANLDESLAQWLEPQRGIDINASICGFATIHALGLPKLERQAKVALLHAWVNSRNSEPETEQSFGAYLPADPRAYIDLAEIVWCDMRENQWAQDLIMQALLRWRELPHVASELRLAFERWLGFVHIYGFSYERGKTAGDAEQAREQINERLGNELPLGPFEFAGRSFTAIEDDGLLRLSRVALALISNLPRGPFVPAIATGCLAEAIMGKPEKYNLFKWVLLTARDPVWAEMKKEVDQLLSVDHILTKQSAHRLLSFEGSMAAYQLQQTLPSNLFPPHRLVELYGDDPCNGVFAWSKSQCEACLRRKDLAPHWLARRAKSFFVDPDLDVPKDFGSRVEPLIETISPDSICSLLGPTDADISFEDFEPALCVYARHAIAAFIRQVARQVGERTGSSLRQLSFRLVEHYPVFDQDIKDRIYAAWKRLDAKDGAWDEGEEFAEMFLFALVLKDLDPEEQLSHLLARRDDARDLVSYKELFLPVTDWECVWRRFADTRSTKAVQRILWFLSANPTEIPNEDIHQRILPFLDHKDSFTRSLVLRIVHASEDKSAIRHVVNSSWAWDSAYTDRENHWGSMLLAENGSSLSYSDLRCRVHPILLGHAVKCQGQGAAEVEQYAEDIHHIWSRLGTTVPDLPPDFPFTEIDSNIVEDIPISGRVRLSESGLHRSVTFFTRHASWGGMDSPELPAWLSASTKENEERRETLLRIAREAIEEQIDAGNHWFAQRFYTYALDQILLLRPDLVTEWWENAFMERPEAVRRVHLGRSFYEALCSVLLHHECEKGVRLYQRLQEIGVTRTQDFNTGIGLLEYALFRAPPTTGVMDAWALEIEQCKSDRDLMKVAIVAQFGSAREWLWRLIEQGVQSQVPLERSRSVALLAFVEGQEAKDLLDALSVEAPDTWARQLLTMSQRRWKTNAWAKHWLRRFLHSDDDTAAWASFRLFLGCVDSRFWLWRRELKAETDCETAACNSEMEQRWAFVRENISTLRNKIRENEKSLEKRFLGQDTLSITHQVWPWL